MLNMMSKTIHRSRAKKIICVVIRMNLIEIKRNNVTESRFSARKNPTDAGTRTFEKLRYTICDRQLAINMNIWLWDGELQPTHIQRVFRKGRLLYSDSSYNAHLQCRLRSGKGD